MKKYFIFLPLIIGIISCNSVNDIQRETVQFHTKYSPVDPVEYGWLIPYVNKNYNQVYSKHSLIATREEKLSFLKNQGTLVSISEIRADGDINFGSTSLSSENSVYRIVMDYAKYKVQQTKYGSVKIGIGLRMVAEVTTSKSDINLGDLFAIGLAAESNYLSGTLSVDVIGMNSKEITYLLPFQSEINKTTIQNAMQALATIKTEIYNDSTEVYPHILAVKPKMPDTLNVLSVYNRIMAENINSVVDTLSMKTNSVDGYLKLLIAENNMVERRKIKKMKKCD